MEEILAIASNLPNAIRNNGGGHYNHSLFWEILSPAGQEAPEDELSEAINQIFGSIDTFKEQFTDAAGSRFDSGWAWLIVTAEGKLEITSTANPERSC